MSTEQDTPHGDTFQQGSLRNAGDVGRQGIRPNDAESPLPVGLAYPAHRIYSPVGASEIWLINRASRTQMRLCVFHRWHLYRAREGWDSRTRWS